MISPRGGSVSVLVLGLSVSHIVLRGAAEGPQAVGLRGHAEDQNNNLMLSNVFSAAHAEGLISTPRFNKILRSILPAFQAAPKNWVGRLMPAEVRDIVHRFFAHEHGQSIRSLELAGWQPQAANASDKAALREKAVAIAETLFYAETAGRGLSIEDVATLVATIENQIFRDGVELLAALSWGYGVNETEGLGLYDAQKLLFIYFYSLRRCRGLCVPEARPVSDEMTKDVESLLPVPTRWDLASDEVLNFVFERKSTANPFKGVRLSFDSMARVATHAMGDLVKLQSRHCAMLKDNLVGLDSHRSGLVPLSKFYSHKPETSHEFSENVGYLRSVGALEERPGQELHVRIVNYILAPSNCAARRSFYSACCVNECEALMSEIEGHVMSPFAFPLDLLAFVANLSSPSTEAPRLLSADLVQRLHAITARRGGQVPLHGRLFAQWLHLAFPHECPFPHVVQDTTVLNATLTPEMLVGEVERAELAGSVAGTEDGGAPEWLWSDEELLPPRVRPPRAVYEQLLRAAPLVSVAIALYEAGRRSCAGGAVACLDKRALSV